MSSRSRAIAALVWGAVGCWSMAAGAAEFCLQYAEDNSVIAGLEDTTGSAAAATAQRAFDGFLEQARRNDVPRILGQHSRLDGSQDFLRQELAKLPDKFSGYAGIQSAKTLRSFGWGNYQLLLTEYLHDRGQLVMAEPVFCTNACQVSNIFERADEPVDLVSRFVYLSQKNRARQVPCPAPGSMNVVEVHPTVQLGQAAPLRLYLRQDLFAAAAQDAGIELEVPDGVRACHAQILELTIGEDVQRARADIQKILDQCAVNTTLGKLIPVVDVSGKPSLSYYGTDAFIGMIKDAVQIKPLYRIDDRGRAVIGTLVKTSIGTTLYAVFPMTTKGQSMLFDWNFFGSGLGEALTSTFAASQLAEVLEAAKKREE